METTALKNDQKKGIHPQVFALWISMGSIIMLFGAWTSAYIVKQAAGNWLEFPIPNVFYLSTALIVLSSAVLHFSFSAFKKGLKSQFQLTLILAFILGLSFVVCQYFGWVELFSYGVDFKGNVSGSFFYLITGAHAAHVLGGLAAMLVTLINAFSLAFSNSDKRTHRFNLVLQYWHFVDALWIYLFIFLLTIK